MVFFDPLKGSLEPSASLLRDSSCSQSCTQILGFHPAFLFSKEDKKRTKKKQKEGERELVCVEFEHQYLYWQERQSPTQRP